MISLEINHLQIWRYMRVRIYFFRILNDISYIPSIQTLWNFTDLRLNKRGIGMLWDFVVGFSEMLWDKIKCCGISLDRLVWRVFWDYEFPVKVIWKMLWDLLWDFYPDLDLLFLFMPSPSLLNANRLPPSPYQNVSKQ